MTKATFLRAIKTTLKTPAGQTAGKTAAIVGGASAAAFTLPTAAGYGLQNLGGGNDKEGTVKTVKGIAVFAAIALVAGISYAFFKRVIK